MDKSLLNAIKGAKIHIKVGENVREYIKPGLSLHDIAFFIENDIKNNILFDSNNPLDKGIGFPTGLSINNLAAHYTPNKNEKEIILKETDILKIDYGVHYQGVIIDSAFTISFNPKYNEFIEFSKKLTNYAVSLCGVDVVLGDIGKDIEEYVKSKNIEIDGKLNEINIMRDLSGHNIKPYYIHAGKAVPNINIYYPIRMQENEFYAIEPFITTGLGKSIYKEPNSHYMLNDKYDKYELNLLENEKIFLEYIKKTYSTLPFCQRWLFEIIDPTIYCINDILKSLSKKKILNEYPPIYDIEGSIISQFEHTIYIKENGIINLTKNKYY